MLFMTFESHFLQPLLYASSPLSSTSTRVLAAEKNDLMLNVDSYMSGNKWALCVVTSGWQGDAVLALLAGPGLGACCVFTQRLRLDGVSSIRLI